MKIIFSIVEFEPQYTQQVKDLIRLTLEDVGITGNAEDDQHFDDDLNNIPSIYQQNPRGNFWVALYQGKVIGTVAVREIDSDTARLNRMFVRTIYHGRGIGQALLDHALNFAREEGYQKITLSTARVMKRAHRFYERNNFQKTGENKDQFFYQLQNLGD